MVSFRTDDLVRETIQLDDLIVDSEPFAPDIRIA